MKPKSLNFTKAWLIAFSIIISGCSTIEGYPSVKKSELPPDTDSVFLFSDEEFNSAKNTDIRNTLIRSKLRDIDLAYSEFESSLYKENIVMDLSTDVTLLALTGGAVLTGSSNEKELLSALSAFILGSKNSFNKRALFENTMSVLVQKMRADRAVIRNDILRGERRSLKTYDIQSASIDISRYYYAGTIPSALTGLAKTASNEEEKAKEEREKITRDLFIADKARSCLIEYWKPNGTIDTNNQNQITSWKDNSKFKEIPFGLFMNGISSSEARVAAVNHLIESGKLGKCEL